MSEYQAVLQPPTDGRMPVIGCHLSSAKGYAAMAKTAAFIDANTFAFFTRNPRGGKAKAIDDADVRAFAEEAALAGIGRIVAHGSYTVNPCAAKEQVRSFAFRRLPKIWREWSALRGSYSTFTLVHTWGRVRMRVSSLLPRS